MDVCWDCGKSRRPAQDGKDNHPHASFCDEDFANAARKKSAAERVSLSEPDVRTPHLRASRANPKIPKIQTPKNSGGPLGRGRFWDFAIGVWDFAFSAPHSSPSPALARRLALPARPVRTVGVCDA